MLVEGVRAIGGALTAGVDVKFALISERLEATPTGTALASTLRSMDVDVTEVTMAELDDLADTEHPQGALLICREPRAELSGLVGTGEGRYLVLDGVQDPGNAGTLARTAAALSIDGLVFLDGSVDPWSPKTVRASAGSLFQVGTVRASAVDAIAAFAGANVPLWVAEADGQNVEEAEATDSFALVLGNEGAGPRVALRDASTHSVAVPMSGSVNSLNVAVAGSILLYELTKESRS